MITRWWQHQQFKRSLVFRGHVLASRIQRAFRSHRDRHMRKQLQKMWCENGCRAHLASETW